MDTLAHKIGIAQGADNRYTFETGTNRFNSVSIVDRRESIYYSITKIKTCEPNLNSW